MGLFDRKTCDICGEKIGLLGNRKLDDGNICKSCANKLSPWFTGRKASTVEAIRAQLAYREANKAEVPNFVVGKTLGKDTKVYISADGSKFIVTRSSNWKNENPDIIDITAVTGVRIDISDSRSEEKRKDSEGKEVSFNPPRYTYDYDVRVSVSVNHPYFSEMNFAVDDDIQISVIGSMPPRPESNIQYTEAVKMAQEIKDTLEKGAAGPAVQTAVKCPHCGATTIPTANGCCEYCGGAIGR